MKLVPQYCHHWDLAGCLTDRSRSVITISAYWRRFAAIKTNDAQRIRHRTQRNSNNSGHTKPSLTPNYKSKANHPRNIFKYPIKMKCIISIVVISVIFGLSLIQAAPIAKDAQDPGFVSATDITGEPVRQKRSSADYYQGDYFICYPKSAVYGKHGYGATNRRSYDSEDYAPHYLADDPLVVRQARADARRAAYTDSFGK